jgi:predicted enzyme related to lactoylglutathione lyase
MDPVVHFEVPFEQADRIERFYQSVFGWKTQALGAETGSYILATTAGATASGGERPGAINGGFYPKKPDWPAQYPSIVIAVGDINASMAKVRDSGGKVLGEPMRIPGVGDYVSFFDTEGNRVSMLQPIPRDVAKPD